MEMKKWLFEANGKEEPIEEPIEEHIEEPIEDVVEEVVEEVAEEEAVEEAPSHLKVGDSKGDGKHRVWWTGEAWVDYIAYRRITGNPAP